MYRPENWQEIRAKAFIPENEWIIEDTGVAFEEGADAMLEGLKAGGWKVTGESVIPAFGDYPEIHLPESGWKGYLVFIPDEK